MLKLISLQSNDDVDHNNKDFDQHMIYDDRKM